MFRKNLKEYWALVLILFLILMGSYYSYSNQGIVYSLFTGNLDEVVSYIQSFGAFAAIILIFITIIEVIAAPIPPLILYIASGILFGTFFGGTLVLVGNVIGAGIAFFISRKFGRNYVKKKIDTKLEKRFDSFFHKYGIFAIFFLRINPLTSSDLVSYLSGLTKMRFVSFIAGTALGLAPLIYLQSYLGSDIIANNPLLFQIFLWISVAYIVVFLFIIFYVKKRRK